MDRCSQREREREREREGGGGGGWVGVISRMAEKAKAPFKSNLYVFTFKKERTNGICAAIRQLTIAGFW